MKKPNLFLVGAPKCGTTSMYTYLRQHPEIFMCHPKEPRYFCRDLINESRGWLNAEYYFPYRSLDDYLALFDGAASCRCVGEASPQYLYSRTAAQEIHQFNPDARILIMLREPVEFLMSQHSQWRLNLHEEEPDFRRALGLEDERRQGRALPANVVFPSRLYYTDWVNFSRQIKRFCRYFPPHQMKIILLDDIKRQPLAVYGEVLAFLQLTDRSFCPDFAPRGQNRRLRFPFLKQLYLDPSAPHIRLLRRIVPAPVLGVGQRFLDRIAWTPSRRPPLDAEFRASLKRRFRPEVAALSQLLDRDLAVEWGYAE